MKRQRPTIDEREMRKRSNCVRADTDMLASVFLVSAGGGGKNGAACELVAFIAAEPRRQAGPHHRVSENPKVLHGAQTNEENKNIYFPTYL